MHIRFDIGGIDAVDEWRIQPPHEGDKPLQYVRYKKEKEKKSFKCRSRYIHI